MICSVIPAVKKVFVGTSMVVHYSIDGGQTLHTHFDIDGSIFHMCTTPSTTPSMILNQHVWTWFHVGDVCCAFISCIWEHTYKGFGMFIQHRQTPSIGNFPSAVPPDLTDDVCRQCTSMCLVFFNAADWLLGFTSVTWTHKQCHHYYNIVSHYFYSTYQLCFKH